MIGGIDLGGSKIEARLFGSDTDEPVAVARTPTPQGGYDAVAAALREKIEWLLSQADLPDMPIGIAVPGIIDPVTGLSVAANVPTSNRAVGQDLERAMGRAFTVVNDCMAFAHSEARTPETRSFGSVMGLILGTGVGGGISVNGRLPARLGGLAVEIGHVALPASAVARHGLSLRRCGCGRLGCMETYVSGTGLANLAEEKLGTRHAAETLVAGGHEDILEIWADIAGECLLTVQLTLAPACIVIGGGLSNMPNVAERLSTSMARHSLERMALPAIRIAKHGDASGARGAALLAAAL